MTRLFSLAIPACERLLQGGLACKLRCLREAKRGSTLPRLLVGSALLETSLFFSNGWIASAMACSATAHSVAFQLLQLTLDTRQCTCP